MYSQFVHKKQKFSAESEILFPVDMYLFRVNNENCRTMREICSKLRDDTHMWFMKIVQFSKPPTTLVHLRLKFFHLFDLGRPISNEPPFSNDFRFQYQLINRVWLSFDFSSFSCLTIRFFVPLYSCVCSCPKIS